MTSRFLFAAAAAAVLTSSLGCGVLRTGACGCGTGVCGDAIGCAVEAGCGCETECCDAVGGGCSIAGQRWRGDCQCDGPRINVCTGPECCDCEPACGCGEPECGVGGCGDVCGGGCGGCGRGPLRGFLGEMGFGARSVACECRRVFGPLFGCLGCVGGCGGCDKELYWSEWHNDPPRCCDPCDSHGGWVGPPSTAHRAPYDHVFSPRRIAKGEAQAGETVVR